MTPAVTLDATAPVPTGKGAAAPYDPFPDFKYSGKLRPAYPLSPKSKVPDHIMKPNYAREEVSSWRTLLTLAGLWLRYKMWVEVRPLSRPAGELPESYRLGASKIC